MIRWLSAWLLGLALGAIMATVASADCPTAWDPSQVYDATSGSLTACVLDTDGATAVCTWTLTGQDGHVAEVAMAGPKLGTPVPVAVPAGIYGQGQVSGVCTNASGARGTVNVYPKVAFPAFPPPGSMVLVK